MDMKYWYMNTLERKLGYAMANIVFFYGRGGAALPSKTPMGSIPSLKDVMTELLKGKPSLLEEIDDIIKVSVKAGRDHKAMLDANRNGTPTPPAPAGNDAEKKIAKPEQGPSPSGDKVTPTPGKGTPL